MIMFALLASHETAFCAARPAAPEEAGETKRTAPAAASESKEYAPSGEEKEMMQKISETSDEKELDKYLVEAAQEGFLHALKMLLDDKKVNPDVIIDLFEMSALVNATNHGHVNCVQALLDADANVNLVVSGATALIEGSMSGNIECVRALLNAGADINFQDSAGNTPVYLAAESGNPECLRELISRKANLSIPNDRKQSPLRAAAIGSSTGVHRRGCRACVQLLIEAGVETDMGKGTPKLAQAVVDRCVRENRKRLAAKGSHPNFPSMAIIEEEEPIANEE